MKLLMKILGFTAAALAGLIVLALVAVQLISDDHYRKWLVGAAESATGRALAIDGQFDVQIGKGLGLSARGIRFANAEWGSRPEMVTADRLAVRLELLPLLKGVVDFTVELEGSDILLETDAAGVGNWVFGAAGETVQAEPSASDGKEGAGAPLTLPLRPYIRNFELSDLAISFHDAAGTGNLAAAVEKLRIFVDGTAIPLTLKAAYRGVPVELHGSLGTIEQWHRNEPTRVALNGRLNEAELTIAGSAGPLLPRPSARLDIELAADDVATFAPFAGVDLPSLQELAVSLTLAAGQGRLAGEDIAGRLNDPHLRVELAGAIGDLIGLSGIDLQAEIDSDGAQDLLQRLGLQLPYTLPPSAHLKAGLSGDLERLALRDLEVMLKDTGLDVGLTGELDNILRPEGGSAELAVSLDSTSIVAGYIGRELPAFGPFTGAARLSTKDGALQVESLRIDLQDPAVAAAIDGSARRLERGTDGAVIIDGIALDARAGTERLPELVARFGLEVPVDVPASLDLRLSSAGSLDRLAITGLQATARDDGVEANLSGTVENVIDLSGIAAQLTATADDTALLSKFAGVELPALGSLTLSSALSSQGDGYRLESLRATLTNQGFKATAEVMIEDLLALSGIHAALDGDLDSLAPVSALAGLQLPETGPWTVRVEADSADPRQGPVTLVAKVNGEGIAAAVTASLPDVKALQTFQADLAIEIESIVRLGAMFDRQFPEDKPMTINGTASATPGNYRLEEFSLTSGESEILADLAYLAPAAAGGRRSLSGELTIRNFDLTHVLAARQADVASAPAGGATEVQSETSGASAAAEQKGEEERSGKKLFSDKPLAVGMLHDYDLDLTIQAANLLLPDQVGLDGEIAVNLDGGHLRVEPIRFTQTSGGTGTGFLDLDGRAEEAVLDLKLDFDRFASPRYGGFIDLDVDLDGRGRSMAALMGSLNGVFAASLRGLQLQRSFMSQFGAGLLKHLNPLDSEKTTLECAVVRFDIDDGIADFRKKIAAQTPDVTWLGGGTINLKTEELDFGFSTKARGALNSLTNIDMASLVHVGGTLAEPKIGLDVADVAMKYGEYTAFIATGGLSFLAQKVVETAQANVDQCERILKDLQEQK